MYCLDVAQLMYVQAASLCLDAASMDSAHDHSQPELDVLSTGAGAKPSLPAIGLLPASMTDAPTVASYHMAALFCCMALAHSLKLKFAAPGSPASLMRLT